MSVIGFSSLKGGVGKTSLSVNVAHGFTRRGCRTLLIDLDPSGHTSRFFKIGVPERFPAWEAPLARLFLAESQSQGSRDNDDWTLPESGVEGLTVPVRNDLDLIPGGEELRHFLWGKGHQAFARKFPVLVEELKNNYDHIVFDTPPDFNCLTRNALAVSDVVVVPVDGSEMSIHSLESLILSAQHIRKPMLSIVRTMVNKQARRTKGLSNARLQEKLSLHGAATGYRDEGGVLEYDIEDPVEFMTMLQDWERTNRKGQTANGKDDRPIYLLRSLVYRTEQQNQLSFVGRTAFDTRATAGLAEQYLGVARELELILSARENEPELESDQAEALGMLTGARESEDALDMPRRRRRDENSWDFADEAAY